MQFAKLAAIALILVAVQVVFAQAQYPSRRHWYMVNRNNPAVDPRTASIYGDSAYRGGLADDLPPLQRSALTDFLSRYFPRLFGPTVVAADPVASLPPGASVLPYVPVQALDNGALPYDTYSASHDDDYNVPAHSAHSAYTGYNYQRPSSYSDRGSYLPYPGRGHAYPPGLAYPLDPYQTGYKKVTL